MNFICDNQDQYVITTALLKKNLSIKGMSIEPTKTVWIRFACNLKLLEDLPTTMKANNTENDNAMIKHSDFMKIVGFYISDGKMFNVKDFI